MLFPKKIRRVIDVEEAEKNFEKEFKKEELEKGDVPAIVIAALLVFLPVAILLTVVLIGIPYLFMMR